MRFGAGLWLFGQFVDRYATDAYGPPVSTWRRSSAPARSATSTVLDINYPFSDPDMTVEEVQRRARRRRASRAATSRRTSTRASSSRGAFTNPDPAVRAARARAVRGGRRRRQAASARRR